MTTTGKILIIDDDDLFVRTLQTLLGEEGYSVDVAVDRAGAMAKLADESAYSVVLLDQKLRGATGPDSGLDLLGEVGRVAPQSRTIVVTGFATDAAIQRAFDLGAYDYLEKNQLLSTMLRVKVRNAAEGFRAREVGRLSAEKREQALQRCWRAVTSEKDPHRKGAQLEELMSLLFESVPGFTDVQRNRRNELEEIDIIFRNESEDPLWREEGAYIIVECKHWTRPVDAREVREFAGKLARRHGRVRPGFFVSMSDFTAGFREETRRLNETDRLIVLIGRQQLEQLVRSEDRGADLKALHERAVIQAGGDK